MKEGKNQNENLYLRCKSRGENVIRSPPVNVKTTSLVKIAFLARNHMFSKSNKMFMIYLICLNRVNEEITVFTFIKIAQLL